MRFAGAVERATDPALAGADLETMVRMDDPRTGLTMGTLLNVKLIAYEDREYRSNLAHISRARPRRRIRGTQDPGA